MSVEASVMPLWRYRSGQFESSFERFAKATGVAHTVIRLHPQPILRRLMARCYVRKLQKTLCRATNIPTAWTDEGEVHYSHQFRAGFELKTFAVWLDVKDLVPEFHSDSTIQIWNAHEERFSLKECTFPLLRAFDYVSGYLVPMDFPKVVEVTEKIWGEKFPRQVISAPALLREIEALNCHLNVPEGWDHKSSPKHRFPPMACLFQLRKILRLSAKHSLPVMFEG